MIGFRDYGHFAEGHPEPVEPPVDPWDQELEEIHKHDHRRNTLMEIVLFLTSTDAEGGYPVRSMKNDALYAYDMLNERERDILEEYLNKLKDIIDGED